MSQENVDLVRRGNAAFRRQDWEAMAATFDPEILVRPDRRWPEQGIFGREAAVAFYQGLAESGSPDVRIEETVDLGDRVLARMRWTFHGGQSGVAGEQPTSMIATLRNGLVILEEFFLEHAEALNALGLEE
ncbi:MAG TPA: nuclear transport factor 2 family protein [Solirubrobacteraceae bacterium]|nr:nuclear transport factor 2 family protein [Solirubrobacteraceae bacterium]